ncbi:MAG: hypothetical protein FWD42_11255, partial [Solirubrobacterales bacterium]|nr:hypothetical protein [Solirubrobacterales bacterium]
MSVALLTGMVAPAGAGATIEAAQAIAGPSNDIIDVDGAALAPDGSGGVLYRQRVGGVVHLFAIPFAGGRFGAPVEVDREDLYGASQPAIAAGDGGRLLVVWVQPRNTSLAGVTLYELQSASIGPGAGGFGQAITVDPSVGEPDTGDVSSVEPRLAMAASGEAYVVYRVVADDCVVDGADAGNPRNRECVTSGGELVEVRVASYNYLLWSALGAVNRAEQVPSGEPSPSNAPSIGIDAEGSGVVAWPEPENPGRPARIWARRLFGATKGVVLQASPSTLAGRPVTGAAEAPSVAVSPYGEARVAFRLQGARASVVPATQLFDSALPDTLNPGGGEFEGASALPQASGTGIGAPSGALDQSGKFRFVWTQGGSVRLVSGGRVQTQEPVTLGGALGGAAQTTLNPAGGGTTAWQASSGGL